MAYSETVLRRAKLRLEQERQAEEESAHRRVRDIYIRYPRLKEIDVALRATVARVAAAAFTHGQDPAAAVEQARKENLELQRERSWILETAELEESDLEITPVCTECRGTGYVGERMCQCLRELCRQEQKKELSSLLGGRETFESFRLDYYPDRPDPDYGVSPRAIMARVYDRCRRYVREFTPGSPSLLFTGGPGLGKTFLSACIARGVAESGHSVVYDTAGRLFADFETAKFGLTGEEREDVTRKYLTTDLLIIDDLGTEMVNQFTQSALYQVVNTRLMDGKATIISTNLSADEIQTKYSPQIASRLLGTYELLTFLGDDIRMKK